MAGRRVAVTFRERPLGESRGHALKRRLESTPSRCVPYGQYSVTAPPPRTGAFDDQMEDGVDRSASYVVGPTGSDMTASEPLFHISPFLSANASHGGTHRTEQIRDLLALSGRMTIEVGTELLDRPGTLSRVRSGARGLAGAGVRRSLRARSLRGPYQYGRAIEVAMALSRQGSTSPAVVWESLRGVSLWMGRALERFGGRTVAVPHNVEALVPGSRSAWTRRAGPDWLAEEIWALRASHVVFAISSHDQFILRGCGIRAELLPYEPPQSLRSHLERVRESRVQGLERNVVLLVGTATNPPTRLGFEEALRFVPIIVARVLPAVKVIVVGAGTDTMDYPPSPNLHVLGRVSQETLEGLMTRSIAAVTHQAPTTGVLTRIPELLGAGIPVLANVDASRSWQGTPGLGTYRDWAEFESLLRHHGFDVPARDAVNGDAERFLAVLEAL